MDVDLSTDLDALLPLVAPLLSGHSDVAIGTRLARGSRVVRGPRREVISRCYNLLLHATLRRGFSDAQCGFKAIRRDSARELLPLVEDTGWFFDTELLVLAERAGLRIHEVPVDWVDDPDSRVDVVPPRWPTCAASPGSAGAVRGRSVRTLRARRRVRGRRGVRAAAELRCRRRFAAIGVASTLAYLLLFLLLRGARRAQAANAIAPAGHRGRQHRGQPPVHVRDPGPPARGRAPARGPARLRLGLGADQRRAGGAARGAPAAAGGGAGRPGGRQRRRHPGPVRALRSWVFPAGSSRPLARPRGQRRRRARLTTVTPGRGGPLPARAPRGRLRGCGPADPRWVRPALLGLLAAPRCSTWPGSAATAGPTTSTPPPCRPARKSWKAFFFGSFDPSNFITVDKPPASLWVMELSARIFGLNYWSMLVPQALEGVGLRSACCTPRCGAGSGRGRAAGRRGAGAHPGGGADVPVQQPGRAARAADGGARPTRWPGPSRGPHPLAPAGRRR